MPTFREYHGVDATTHRARVVELTRAGFRPVALDVAGDPADARYSAVWVERPGPEWSVVSGLDAAGYQARFDELTGRGFAPTTVSATGPAGSAVYAAVFEQGVPRRWFARHDLRWGPDADPGTITHENARAGADGYLPRSLAIYGDPADRRFAGVWVENSDAVPWSWWLTSAEAFPRFLAALAVGGLRPAALSVGPDGMVLSVFRGDRLDGWTARYGLGGATYQAELDAQAAQGRRPIVVDAGGAPAGPRYAAVFAVDDVPAARAWTVSGAAFPAAADLDEAVRAFMHRNGIRAGAVAVSRGGTVVGARGYTWAEPGYPPTRPETTFRIASLSKMFTAAALTGLVEAGRLDWTARAFPLVGVTAALPAGTASTPGMSAITVQQLVLRASRLPRDFDRAPRDLARALGVGAGPVPRDRLLRYLYGLPLVGAVPAGGLYSNAAFYLLTSVVERAAGVPFAAALDRYVLRELGIDDVAVAATGAAGRHPGEVSTYDDVGVGASQLDYAVDALAPGAYGGDFVLENGEGAGGLVTSAISCARLISRYPVWNADAAHLTGRELATRFGALNGTCSGATSRADGLDAAFVFNRRVGDAEHSAITDALHAVLTAHAAQL